MGPAPGGGFRTRTVTYSGWGAAGMPLNAAVDALKRRLIQDALRDTGSKTRAAERLGIPRQSLQKMMKRLGLSG